MKYLYWLASWTCYYLGDLSSKALMLLDDYEMWCGFWYPIYNRLMCWSGEIQDAAGYDPQTGADTSKWPWFKAEDNTEE
jgi:hypothetical protein